MAISLILILWFLIPITVISEESRPHWLTCGEVLDYHTVVGGDKFDSIVVARVRIGTLTLGLRVLAIDTIDSIQVPETAKEMDSGGLGGHTTLRLRGDTPYLTNECLKVRIPA